jgi:hypothetical protein
MPPICGGWERGPDAGPHAEFAMGVPRLHVKGAGQSIELEGAPSKLRLGGALLTLMHQPTQNSPPNSFPQPPCDI